MPIADIKQAVQKLIQSNLLAPPNLGVEVDVETIYRYADAQSPAPLIVIWNQDAQEKRDAGKPNSGLKQITWPIIVHLVLFSRDPKTDGPNYDQLLDSLLAVLRASPRINGLATKSHIFKFGEDIKVYTPPIDANQSDVLFQSVITAMAVEWLNA